jgi:hypothetical protein
MHPRTEDLLSVRDGEPVDAEVRAAIKGDAAHSREVERLGETRHALQELPELAAPDGIWARIEAVERETRPRGYSWRLRAAGVGVAAAVAVAAVLLVGIPSRPRNGFEQPREVAPGLQTNVIDSTTGSPTLFDPLVSGQVTAASYPALVQESARLDRMLRRLSYQRPMMSGETATTIAGLEDRIALIDEQLTYSNARGVPQPERTALWGERVELMNALVHVRYAQAQPTGF